MQPVMKVLGIEALEAATLEVSVEMEAAALAGTRAVSSLLKRRIRANLKGEPRWNHRGASRIYAKSVTLSGKPYHSPRSGPPGSFTGHLRAGVGSKKPKITAAGTVEGGVGVGGRRSFPENNLKKRLEQTYPFFAPAVESVVPQFEATYEAAFTKALLRKRG